MDKQKIKRGPGRPPKYSTEEERKDAIRRKKNKVHAQQRMVL